MKKKQTDSEQTQDTLVQDTMSKKHRAVSRYLSTVKFQPSLLGVDPADVWRKIEKLCELYEDALDAERARGDEMEKNLRRACNQLKRYNARFMKENARGPVEKAEPRAGSPEEKPNGEA